MNEIEILEKQFEILEQLKQKQTEPNISLLINDNDYPILVKNFKNEKKTENISARVKPTPKKIIEDSEYSYADALEYFANVILSKTEESNEFKSVNEYIHQRFQGVDGTYELDNHYMCRIAWFENGFPSFKELAEFTGHTISTIQTWSSIYKWKEIKRNAIDKGYTPENNISIEMDCPIKDFENATIERSSKQYSRYRKRVLKRDKVCQCCGNSEDLEVHHPMPFNQYNSLGADTNNGIVLCKECHDEYHHQYGKKERCNSVTLAQFLRDYGKPFQSDLDDLDATNTMIEEDNLDFVLELVKKLESAYGSQCPENVLLSELDSLEYDKDYASDLIRQLNQKGLIYYPTTGYIKIA